MSEPIFARATGWLRTLKSAKKLQLVQLSTGWSVRYADRGSALGFVIIGLYNRETGAHQTVELTTDMANAFLDKLASAIHDVQDKVTDHNDGSCGCPAHGGQG